MFEPVQKSAKAIYHEISAQVFAPRFTMAYLKHLPIDSLKIDRAFITDIPGDSNDTAIAIAIIRLAEALNLTVIAEGVENIEQANLLLGERCQVAQGFYFARPMPAAQFMQFAIDYQQDEKKRKSHDMRLLRPDYLQQ